MKTVAVAFVLLCLVTPALADMTEQYTVRNAQDLVSLCGRDASAVDYVAALNFCHGYTGGAYAYYQSVVMADPDSKIVCVKEPYPELLESRLHVSRVIRSEEERFGGTLTQGLEMLAELSAGLRAKGLAVVPGESVFKLSDTYGFPAELTEEETAWLDADAG